MTQLEASQTPLAIKILGWILIIGGVLAAAKILALGGAFEPDRNAWNFVSKAGAAISGYGILNMKRWGVYLYFGLYALNTALLFLWPPSADVYEKYTSPIGLIMMSVIPILVALVVARHWRKMA